MYRLIGPFLKCKEHINKVKAFTFILLEGRVFCFVWRFSPCSGGEYLNFKIILVITPSILSLLKYIKVCHNFKSLNLLTYANTRAYRSLIKIGEREFISVVFYYESTHATQKFLRINEKPESMVHQGDHPQQTCSPGYKTFIFGVLLTCHQTTSHWE